MDSTKFEDIVLKKIKDTVNLLEEEWHQIKLPNSQKANRKLIIYSGICDLCDKVLAEERNLKEKMLQRIKDNKSQLMKLCQELHEDLEIPDELSVLEIDTFLQYKIAELQEEKQQKLLEFQKFAERDEHISTYLGENSYCLANKDVLPIAEEVALLRRHLEEMEEEKKRRVETYQSLRKDIVCFVEQLEKRLEVNILLDVVCNSEQETSLTNSFLLDVRKLHSDLEFEVKELESQSLKLREKISSLWNLLQIPEDTKEAFLSTVPLNTPSSITQLENHLSELKELRLKNMGRFIEDLRTELEKWLAKCYIGESQKNAFNLLSSREVTEDILEALEMEVDKWKKYYQSHSHIFEKVDHFLALFDNMQQLEEKVKDPTRLFNTRGGALLQEEKERKRVKLELPQVEKQLINLCAEYETVNEQPFLIDGNSIEEYLCKLWNYHSIQKEEERKTRLQSKSKTPTLMKGFKGAKRPLNIATPGSGCRKRGREADDKGETAHAKKIANTPGIEYPGCSTRLYASPLKGQLTNPGHISVPKMRPLSERNRLAPPLWQPVIGDESSLQNSLSYDNFKERLQNQGEVFNSTSLSAAQNHIEDEELESF